MNHFQCALNAPPLTYSFLSSSFLDAVPTAELEPISDTYVQSDEVKKQTSPAKSSS
jgi:hypothetical protein